MPKMNLAGVKPIKQNRAKHGLFAGKHVQFGNQVSHSNRKTRRMWRPNVQKHRYWSETLGEEFRLNVTTHAMRCIDKAGGLDNFIMNQNYNRAVKRGELKVLELRAAIKAAKKAAAAAQVDAENGGPGGAAAVLAQAEAIVPPTPVAAAVV